MKRKQFIPALKYDLLTPLYDGLIACTLPERAFKEMLVRQAEIKKNAHVLDLGCGTGTLALLIKNTNPEAHVWGLDADLKIIALAKKKAKESGTSVAFYQGLASNLPWADSSIDVVFSSLFFHHLNRMEKTKAMREVLRILKPGGEIHIADWGRPHDPFMRAAFLMVQALDGFETTADNVRGLLPNILRDAGFRSVREGLRHRTLFGTLSFYSATKGNTH